MAVQLKVKDEAMLTKTQWIKIENDGFYYGNFMRGKNVAMPVRVALAGMMDSKVKDSDYIRISRNRYSLFAGWQISPSVEAVDSLQCIIGQA